MMGEEFFCGTDAPGTVAFRLPWHFCSPLRYRNGHWQFLQIRDNKKMGLMGRVGLMGRMGGMGVCG